MTLRDELRVLAAGAPVARVPPDTYRRGRAARRRTTAVTIAAVVAVVAGVAGAAAWWPTAQDVPVAATTTGVPDHLYAVPDHVDPQSDLVVPDAAVAWSDPSTSSTSVVDSAGGYHLIALPGLTTSLLGELALNTPSGGSAVDLSPDGTRIAYLQDAEGNGRIPDHLAVTDLTSGTTTTLDLPPGPEGSTTEPYTVTWSADGSWLAWMGRTDLSSGTTAELVAGRMRPDGNDADRWTVDRSSTAVGVDDQGRLLTATSTTLTTVLSYDEGVTAPLDLGRIASPLRASPDGSRVGVGVGANGPADVPAPGTSVTVVDDGGVDGRTEVETWGRSPAGPGPGQETSALGWVGSRLLVQVAARDDGPGQLVLAGRGPAALVAVVDPGVGRVSVATGLMDPDDPTVTHPVPDWPADVPWSWVLAALAGGAGLVTVMAARRRAR